MISTEIPKDEDLRLFDVDSCHIARATHADFDELNELAAQLCNCPVSVISFVEKDKQWYKLRKGVPLTQTLKDISFSTHVILAEEHIVVEDTKKDTRFYNTKAGSGEMDIRFFACTPIRSSNGRRLGSICVIDSKPRSFTQTEIAALKIIAGQVTRLLELQNQNIIIRKMAEEIIGMKDKAIVKSLTEQEEDKQVIAANLHEDMAQSVAACIHHLKIAETNQEQRLHQITEVEKELALVLDNMRQLSYAIKPNSMEWVPVEELIKEFIEKKAKAYPFTIQFDTIGNQGSISSEKALFVMRIIEHWLKSMRHSKGIRNVNICISTAAKFELIIEDNRPLITYEELKKELFDSLVFEMVRTRRGIVDICHHSGWNMLQIILPFGEG